MREPARDAWRMRLKPWASTQAAASAPLPATRIGTSRLISPCRAAAWCLHTCNPRLHFAQLIYIVNHAEDRVMFFDRGFAPLIEELAPQCPLVTHLDLSVRRRRTCPRCRVS